MGVWDSLAFWRRFTKSGQVEPEVAKPVQTPEGSKAVTDPYSKYTWNYERFRMKYDRREYIEFVRQMLRDDPRLAAVNRFKARLATRQGITVSVALTGTGTTDERKAQQRINSLLTVCQVNAKLLQWARSLPRDGDLFLNLVIDLNERRVRGIKKVPAHTMERLDDRTGNFPDPAKAFCQLDPIMMLPELYIPLGMMNHIRWQAEDGIPYGESDFVPVREFFKRVQGMEDDQAVMRRTRGPERNLWNVGTKEQPGQDREVNDFRANNEFDDFTTVNTDIFANGRVSVNTLGGQLADFDKQGDIVHQEETFFITGGVARSLVGYGENINRDILDQQRITAAEGAQEVQYVLEFGDGGPFSGIRAIIDLDLRLAGIAPERISYTIHWPATGFESPSQRLDDAGKLRKLGASRRFVFSRLADDLGLKGAEDVDAMLAQADQEAAEDARAVGVPLTGAPGAGDGEPPTDAVKPKNIKWPNSTAMQGVRSDLEDLIRQRFAGVRSLMFEGDKRREVMTLLAEIQQQAEHEKTGAPIAHRHIEYLRDDTVALLAPGSCGHVHSDGAGDKPAAKIPEPVKRFLVLFGLLWLQDDATFIAALLPLMRRAAAAGYRAAAERLGQEPVEDYIDPGVLRTLRQEVPTRWQGITATTKQLLALELTEAYEAAEPLASWVDRIATVLEIPGWRNTRIAKSEVAWAFNQSPVAAYRSAGVTLLQRVENVTSKTCEPCRDDHLAIYAIGTEPPLPAHPECEGHYEPAD